MHGGVAKDALGNEDVEALKKGCANLARHIANIKKFGVPAVVAINRFIKDTDAELQAIQAFTKTLGVDAVVCEHWGKGSEGTERSEEHTSELQSLMRISYAVFCLKKKKQPWTDKITKSIH